MPANVIYAISLSPRNSWGLLSHFQDEETEDQNSKGTWYEVVQGLRSGRVIQNQDDGLRVQCSPLTVHLTGPYGKGGILAGAIYGEQVRACQVEQTEGVKALRGGTIQAGHTCVCVHKEIKAFK